MSKRITIKSFDLDYAFLKYRLAHPEVSEKIALGAHVIYQDTSDPEFNRVNEKLIREPLRRGKKCYRIIKNGRRWLVKPVKTKIE
jgi:hypothetical protein